MKKLCILMLLFAVLFVFQLTAFSENEIAENQNRRITHFELVLSSDMPSRCYEIFSLEDGYWLSNYNGPARHLDEETVQELQQIIEIYDVLSWDGFEGSNPYVLDGEGFRLDIEFSDGVKVHATGDNSFPEHYFDASYAMESLLEQAFEDSFGTVCGTYVYEGEGFGGDFTITLNEDGTYTFYEGMLSSYLGGGKWDQQGAQIWMSETNGFSLYFAFLPIEDALVFAEEYSDNFVYVKVPDGGRFLRVDPAEVAE